MDEEAHDTSEGEGARGARGAGGRSMANTSGLGEEVGRKRSMGRPSNVAFGNGCSNK